MDSHLSAPVIQAHSGLSIDCSLSGAEQTALGNGCLSVEPEPEDIGKRLIALAEEPIAPEG